jgi:tetratricopeptide (TPR) repeat protein
VQPVKYSIAVIFFLAILLSDCSVKKDKPINRFYHQLTTHYNGYFNAREIMRQREQTFANNYKYVYDELLPVFLFPSEEEAKSWQQDMDKVIEKCNRVIVRHSMFIRKKERNKWIDESYLLMAKAHMYKYDFTTAIETYEFVAQNFKGDPSRIDALMGMIQCYMHLKQYNKAANLINLIDNDEKITDEDQKVQYYAIKADYFITKQKWEDAIEWLNKAMVKQKNKKIRSRWAFILAQLSQKIGNFKDATKYYSLVIKWKPDYEMEFQAKLFRAIYFDVASGKSGEIKKELLKMLADKKNKEYRDQIYFALGELALRENEEATAMDYFAKAAAVGNNKKIKWQAYLRLGKYYFAKPDYKNAAAYYDSCLMNLDNNHPDFYEIEDRTKALKNLVKYINIVEKEDSLLRVAEMPEEKRKEIIEKLIAQAKEKQESEQTQGNFLNNNNAIASNNTSTGEWYFYNPTALGFGFTEFRKRWGDRPLEDNWRRSVKMSSSFNLANDQDSSKQETTKPDNNPMFSEEYYLKDLPLTQEQKMASHAKILDAYYQLGFIYKENFNDLQKSIDAFEKIVEKYDTSELIIPVYYQLFRNYQKIQNFSKAEHYKNLLLEKAPYSDYARLINDPDYLKNQDIDKKRVENYYSAAYNYYKNGDYQTSLTRCLASFENFPDNHIMDKFSFLKAINLGKLYGNDTLKTLLNEFVKTYPQSEEKPLAEEILKKIDQINQTAQNAQNNQQPAKKIEYLYTPMEDHFFVALIDENKISMNNVKNYFSNFNTALYSQKQLFSNSILFNDQFNMLQIKTFPNLNEAMNYYDAVSKNHTILKYFHQAQPVYFVISKSNFQIFYKEKDIEGYQKFFSQIKNSQ